MLVKKITAEFFQRLNWLYLRPFMLLFCNLKINGQQHIKGVKGNFIIASNHTNELDPILISSCLPFFSIKLPLFFVTKGKGMYDVSGIKKLIYGGTFFKIIGGYPYYANMKNYELSLRDHIDFAEKGHSLCIFPAGKIYTNDTEIKARGGLGFLISKMNLPVIPVYIQGIQGYGFKDFILRKSHASVTFGEPIYKKDLIDSIIDSTEVFDYTAHIQISQFILDKIHTLKQK